MNFLSSLFQHRALVFQLARRNVTSRYKGSVLGLLWAMVLPLVMLAVYTFVFGVVFKARWGLEVENGFTFAVILFSGLILFNFFAECLTAAPGLVVSNPSYVKKVIFPVEILIWVSLFSSGFLFLISFVVLLGCQAVAGLPIPWTVVLVPFVLIPLILLTAGLSWFLASLGVFLRDISHIVGIVTSLLLFLSPIFYPISAIPESFRIFILLNPISGIIQTFRDVVLWGNIPSLELVLGYYLVSVSVACAGYTWFARTKKGFADVI